MVEGERVLRASNVIWCTGFEPGFSWIDLPVFGRDGEPVQERGAVAREPGLFFVGLHFLYAFSSTMIHGVGRDAEHVAERIAARARVGAVPEERLASSPRVDGAEAAAMPERMPPPRQPDAHPPA